MAALVRIQWCPHLAVMATTETWELCCSWPTPAVMYGVNSIGLGYSQVGPHGKSYCWSHWSKEENATKEKYRKTEVVLMRYRSPARGRRGPWAGAWCGRSFCHCSCDPFPKDAVPGENILHWGWKNLFRPWSLNHFNLLLVALPGVLLRRIINHD